MGGSIRVGKVLGIPLEISYSWFIIFGLVTYFLSEQYGDDHSSWSGGERWALALGTSILFFLSVLTHELSHSLLALRRGIPVLGITLFVFGGVSRIAREAQRPSTEFFVSAVGPFSSFILGLVFLGLHYSLDGVNEHLSAMAAILASVNFSLGVFNMLPGFPLDGGRVLRAVVWWATKNYWRATLIATRGGQVMAFLMIAGGLAIVFRGDTYQGLWLAAIGWFLGMASSDSYRQFRMREGLQGHQARDLMSVATPVAPRGMTLTELSNRFSTPTGGRFCVVAHEGRPLGLITLKVLSRIDSKQWPFTSVEAAMVPLTQIVMVQPEEDAFNVLELMQEKGVSLALVAQNGQLLGHISRESASRSMRKDRRNGPYGGRDSPTPEEGSGDRPAG